MELITLHLASYDCKSTLNTQKHWRWRAYCFVAVLSDQQILLFFHTILLSCVCISEQYECGQSERPLGRVYDMTDRRSPVQTCVVFQVLDNFFQTFWGSESFSVVSVSGSVCFMLPYATHKHFIKTIISFTLRKLFVIDSGMFNEVQVYEE